MSLTMCLWRHHCDENRYGNMKTNVMGLTAVMPDGRIIKTGSKYVFVG